MVWTYDLAKLATSDRYKVRRLVGDVIPNDPLLQDEEVDFSLVQRSNIYGAAAECCLAIAAQFARKANTAIQGMNVTYSNQSQAYAARAAELEAMATRRGAGGMPYAGGISEADKITQEADEDRVEPQFVLGMDDNLVVPGGGPDNPEANTSETT